MRKINDIKQGLGVSCSAYFNRFIDDILLIPDSITITHGKIPVNAFIQEAENLYLLCIEDKKCLLSAGFKLALITQLKQGIKLLSEAEAVWRCFLSGKSDEQTAINEAVKKVEDLKKTILHGIKFALRNNTNLLHQIKAGLSGKSKSALVQHLAYLKRIGQKYSKELKEIRFDFKLLKKSEQLASKLSALIAEKNVFSEKKLVKKIRDKAYTSLKHVTDEVYRYGRHCFYDNKDKLKKYLSSYFRASRIKQKKTKTTKLVRLNTELSITCG